MVCQLGLLRIVKSCKVLYVCFCMELGCLYGIGFYIWSISFIMFRVNYTVRSCGLVKIT